jgi:hypothetical protein
VLAGHDGEELRFALFADGSVLERIAGMRGAATARIGMTNRQILRRLRIVGNRALGGEDKRHTLGDH